MSCWCASYNEWHLLHQDRVQIVQHVLVSFGSTGLKTNFFSENSTFNSTDSHNFNLLLSICAHCSLYVLIAQYMCSLLIVCMCSLLSIILCAHCSLYIIMCLLLSICTHWSVYAHSVYVLTGQCARCSVYVLTAHCMCSLLSICAYCSSYVLTAQYNFIMWLFAKPDLFTHEFWPIFQTLTLFILHTITWKFTQWKLPTFLYKK